MKSERAGKKAPKIPQLLDLVKKACQDLAGHGWAALLAKHGINLRAKDLAKELAKPLSSIDRHIPGFEDFALEGVRGIEAGKPSLSLLYHAFASPQVVSGASGVALKKYPTPAQIEAVENYVYGVHPPSLLDLRAKVGDAPMAVVVFVAEYRPAVHTVQRLHADMCYSRVGVARIGTAPAKYVPEARGYLSEADSPHDLRVLPCRYGAYLVVQMKGDPKGFGPIRFQERSEVSRTLNGESVSAVTKGDNERSFWVPVQKLFSGSECIRGLDLEVSLTCVHVNEKLNRVHRAFGREGLDGGWHAPDLDKPPFRFNTGIAEFSQRPEDGTGLVMPVVHETLIEQAKGEKGKLITYTTPTNREPFRSSVIINSRPTGARTAPEYVHARHRLTDSGKIEDLNDLEDVAGEVEKGGYQALHYVDYTGDGFVDVECPALVMEFPRTIPAYSLVAAADFFPRVNQQELMQWWRQSVPPDLIDSIWPENPGPPLTLSDTRYPANQSLTLKKLKISNDPQSVFDVFDDTISAIVGAFGSGTGAQTMLNPAKTFRSSSLPDNAAGVFAPGWDVSIDRTDERDANDDGAVIVPGVTHLNNYGLGSPFPEDAMLCAALSSFWPAAAPDITRVFAPKNYATTTPLTDEVLGIGAGATPWDGIPGPFVPDPKKNEIEFRAIEYGDYVSAALEKKFNFAQLSGITAAEYGARTLAMARVYASVGAITRVDKAKWVVFSFRLAPAHDAERIAVEKQTEIKLNETYAYWFKLFQRIEVLEHPGNHKAKLVTYRKMLTFLADPQTVFQKKGDGTWDVKRY